jgi:hypothetical protein
VLLYGPEGVGKTSFLRDAPDPLILCAESANHSGGSYLTPKSWLDTLDIVRALYKDPMGYKTLGFDTIDWLEPLAVRHVCERDNDRCKKKLILEDGRTNLDGYGYGKGSDALLEEWRVMLHALSALSERHGMNIVLLGHYGTLREKNLAGDDYGIIGPKIDKKVMQLLCEWPDAVLYAEFTREVVAVANPEQKGSKAKVVTSGDRICWTQNRGAHRAKNRDGMPEHIPFSWAEFARYALADHAALRAKIDALLKTIGDPALDRTVREYIVKNRNESGPLLRSIERLEARLAKKSAPSTTTDDASI